jgi:hypothetical protein
VTNEFLKLHLIETAGKDFKILDEKALLAMTVLDR